MQESPDQKTWKAILDVLEDKLQYALLKQTETVVDVRLDGTRLTLRVTSDEALDFFSREINQQRLKIAGRTVADIQTITVEKVNAEPLR